jgi:hypothetical protein
MFGHGLDVHHGPEPAGRKRRMGLLHDLAVEFLDLQKIHGTLRADFAYKLGSGLGDWKLTGASRTAPIEFEILAIRGASSLPVTGVSGLHAWLDALRIAQGNFNFKLAGIEQNADGSEGAHHYTASIPRVCEASAILCRELERRALEADYQEKQRNILKSPLLPRATTGKVIGGEGASKTNKTIEAKFPDRAVWLSQRLAERSWNKHDVYRKGGPDHKSVQKVLDGRGVREDLLERLARALSQTPLSMKLSAVNLLDIPQS